MAPQTALQANSGDGGIVELDRSDGKPVRVALEEYKTTCLASRGARNLMT
jgi:hypothetical protein